MKTPIKTVLHDGHLALGGRIVDFGGFALPVQYRSIIEEHEAVRTGAGIFDVCHMARFFVRGPGAAERIRAVTTNDNARLGDGNGQYSLLLDGAGLILDDLIIYRLASAEWLVIGNAGKSEMLLEAFGTGPGEASLMDAGTALGMIALQGPNAPELCARLIPGVDPQLPYFGIAKSATGWLVARTGYTGERGYEILAPAGELPGLFHAMIEAGAVPAGLGARDTLRLEMGYPLWGNDLAGLDPLSAGLAWAVRKDDDGFRGAAAVRSLAAAGAGKRLHGFIAEGREIPRHGYPVRHEGREIGHVTSGAFSPTLRRGIGLALLDQAYPEGTALSFIVRGGAAPAQIQSPPFVPSRVR
jgi:aminomethyltransferase